MRKSVFNLETGLVVNAVLINEKSDYTPPEGFAIGPDAEIGDSVIDGVVVPQPKPEPEVYLMEPAEALVFMMTQGGKNA